MCAKNIRNKYFEMLVYNSFLNISTDTFFKNIILYFIYVLLGKTRFPEITYNVFETFGHSTLSKFYEKAICQRIPHISGTRNTQNCCLVPDTHVRDSNRCRGMDITRPRSNKREIDENEVELDQISYSALCCANESCSASRPREIVRTR